MEINFQVSSFKTKVSVFQNQGYEIWASWFILSVIKRNFKTAKKKSGVSSEQSF